MLPLVAAAKLVVLIPAALQSLQDKPLKGLLVAMLENILVWLRQLS